MTEDKRRMTVSIIKSFCPVLNLKINNNKIEVGGSNDFGLPSSNSNT